MYVFTSNYTASCMRCILYTLYTLVFYLLLYVGILFTDVFFVFCFLFFSVRHKNTRQPFSGTAEWIFMKLLPNNSGDNGVCIAVPKWGLGPPINFWGLKTTHCALGGDAWRVTEN